MLWRISVATVAENGPFSRFPGIHRNLTVIDGPGFRIAGDGVDLQADLLVPVAFPGDAVVSASGVTGPSRDFNVMVATALAPPQVTIGRGTALLAADGTLALYLLDNAKVGADPIAAGHLILSDEPVAVTGRLWISVSLPPQ